MIHTQFLNLLLHDIVVHIVQQSQVLPDDSHPHLLELALELRQVTHDDLDAPAEEASLEGADPRPLPTLLPLLRHTLRTQLSQKQPAVAREEVADHLSAAQRVVLVVVGRAEPTDGEQQTLNECFQGACQLSGGRLHSLEVRKYSLDGIPQLVVHLGPCHGLIGQISSGEVSQGLSHTPHCHLGDRVTREHVLQTHQLALHRLRRSLRHQINIITKDLPRRV